MNKRIKKKQRKQEIIAIKKMTVDLDLSNLSECHEHYKRTKHQMLCNVTQHLSRIIKGGIKMSNTLRFYLKMRKDYFFQKYMK